MPPWQANEVVKTQGVRVLDVLVIGPLMLWGGLRLMEEHPVSGTALAIFGVSTVIYNARNFGRVWQAAKSLGASTETRPSGLGV
jgi:hypothetical protein